MTKSTITRERLEQLANFKGAPVTRQEEQELAHMALAAMDSEPVIIVGDDSGDALSYRRLLQSFAPGTKLYRHAQPAPVVPAVSDDIGEIRVGRLPTMNQEDYPGLGDWWVQLRIGEDSDEVLARVYGATPQEANSRAEALACRAAMLQAEPVTTANKLPDDFDFDRFNDVTWLECVASNPHMHSPTTSTIARVALELNKRIGAGNSPVIGIDPASGSDRTVEVRYVAPTGYVMVPKEPTESMINAWLSEVANWRGHVAGYKAALAAAPQDTPALDSVQSVVTVSDTWIPVSERMPDENAEQQVLACFNGGDISTLYYFEGRWDDAYGIVPIRQDVTHWMPLPAAPQEVK